MMFPLLEKYAFISIIGKVCMQRLIFIIFNLQWFSVKEDENLFLLVLGDGCAQM